MKNLVSLFLALIVLSVFSLISCNNNSHISQEEFHTIVDDFIAPKDNNRVWAYYYWYNDNVSKEGITKDLEAMKQAGIGTAFIGNINWAGKDGKVPVFSDYWWECMVHAVNEGHRLGIDIGVFNCPGWSQSGGPWIKPDMAMRYLTYSETKVSGGRKVKIRLKKPKKDFQDVRTLAFRAPGAEKKDLRHLLKNAKTSLKNTNVRYLLDRDTSTTVAINTQKDPVVTFEFETKEPITARQFTIKPATRIKCNGEVHAVVDGRDSLLKTFVFDRSLLYINGGPNVGPIVYGELAIALPGIRARRFSVVLKDFNAFNKYVGGINKIAISEMNISEAPVLDHFIEKQLGKMYPSAHVRWDSYLWKEQNEIKDSKLIVNEVKDISGHVDENGNLDWDAPEGQWTIMRIGMSPTGSKNLPTSPRGRGYEVDKMSRELIKVHFKKFVGELLKRIPEESKPAFKYAIMDSYETGSQNWTDDYKDKFRNKYGYDPVKYLPVLSGRIVGSVEESERFLWDLRRAVADDIAYKYVAGLREISHANGLKIWLENYGHWGFPAEFMMYGGQSDNISGEFWSEGTLGNIECKDASTTVHAYGKSQVYSEAFTAMGDAYLRYPGRLKKRGDWAVTQGINHFVFHVYIHQPYEDKYPGIDAWFGTEFNRHNTWFSQLHNYTDYIRRNQLLMQQGKYVADVCYFIGENTPIMTGRPFPATPKGHSFDYINAEVILNRLTVKDGRLTLPDGMSYKVMVLPQLNTMRPAVLARIEELVKQGAVILGSPPEKSPSLQNYPQCDKQVKDIASRLWSKTYKGGKMKNVYRKGIVYDSYDLATILKEMGVERDFITNDDSVLFSHRSLIGMDIYFLTNQSDKVINIEPSFRVSGLKPQLWNAVTGEIRELKEYSVKNGRTVVPLTMEAQRSWLVVFANNKNEKIKPALESNFPEYKPLAKVEGPFEVDFVNKKFGPKRTQTFNVLEDLSRSSNDSIKYYSGKIVYKATFSLDKLPSKGDLFIRFGKVAVMAEVKVNGKYAGGVWTVPYRLNISKYVKKGENTLEVEVVNLWRNRLIKDKSLPKAKRLTWTSTEHDDIKPDEQPPSSGLIGPVSIELLK